MNLQRYKVDKEALKKRVTDALEKLSVLRAGMGLFQDKTLGIWLGIFCFLLCLLLSGVKRDD